MENKDAEYWFNEMDRCCNSEAYFQGYDNAVKINSQDMRWDCFITNAFDIENVESELELLFAENIQKYLSDVAQLTAQVEVNTICGKFRLDFVVECNGKKYAFECDGKKFHDEFRDEWRDAMILGAGAVDFIYRLRGCDLYYHLEDCLYVISKWNPPIFSQRGLINLTRLASEEVQQWSNVCVDTNIAHILYPDDSAVLNPFHVFIERRCMENLMVKREFWKTLFAYAIKYGGGNLDNLIQQYRNERGI